MTDKRDAKTDLQICGIGDSFVSSHVLPYWIKEAESRRIRAEAAEQEAEKWRVEAFRKYPTPEAYELACAAIEKHRARADEAEQERDKLQLHLKNIYALCQEETTGEGSAAVMTYIDSIGEGSQPDGE